MIFDTTTLLSNAQAVTATAASTNVIDLGAPGTIYGADAPMTRDIGKGTPIPLLVQVVSDFGSGAGDSTLTIALQFDSTTTVTPDKSIDLGTFAEADLVAGWQLPIQAVPDGADMRYMRLNYTVAGTGSFTSGNITAGIVMGRQTNG